MSSPFGSGSFGSSSFSLDPFYTTKDIIDAVLRHTGHSSPSQETTKRTIALEFINNRYARIVGARHWKWLYQTVDTTFHAPYETGTITVTQGSEVVTGLGTFWSSNIVPNNKIIIAGEIYTIASVDSQTQLKLEGEYAGSTASALSYQIVRPIYQAPSDADQILSITLDNVGELVPTGTQEIRRKSQYDPTFISTPRWFTETKRQNSGVWLYEVWPLPDKKYNVHIDYKVTVCKLTDEDDSFPLIPDQWRHVLYYGALAEMFRYLRDPVNSQSAEADHVRCFTMMQNDRTLTESKYQIQPSRNYRNRKRSRHYRVAIDTSDFAKDE